MNNTPTFDSLTPDEKRRLITALSMGKLSEDEIRELKEVCAHSHLTEAERSQLMRAFALSRMTDEERRALLLKRKQDVQTHVPTAVPARPTETQVVPMPAQTTSVIPHTDTQDANSAPKQTPSPLSLDTAQLHTVPPAAPTVPQQKTQHDAQTVHHTSAHTVGTASVRRMAEEDIADAPTDATPLVRAPVQTERTPPSYEKPKKKSPPPEEYEEADHTAITSLLKGIVYIVSVLVISIFAAWTIIEVANDVFAFVKDDEIVSVVIEEDMTVNDVAQLLYTNGIIKYPTVYELYVRIKEESTNYLIGEYEISPSMNYGDLNDTFTYIENTKEQVVITIPEGYTIDQIIDLMLKNGIGTKEGFVAAINDYAFEGFRFIDELVSLDPDRKYRLEGYLFPDTYYFFKDSSEVAVIYKFLQNFDRKVGEEYYERAEQLGMSLDDMITLASMIQAEGMTLSDFENISSVFHNRLDNPRNFPLLQSDATLQYILDKRKTALTAADLAIDSKYNSYLYAGLPPGSICNPGMDAIDCAMYPADTDYYYFLADGKGNTYFSKTNEEHEALKKEHIG